MVGGRESWEKLDAEGSFLLIKDKFRYVLQIECGYGRGKNMSMVGRTQG